MTFEVGESVVHPGHGAAVITDVETRRVKGEDKLYLVLNILGENDLTVRVPAGNVEMVGVRDPIDEAGLERVYSILRDADAKEPSNWSRRFKANVEKLHSGDIRKVAEVVRDLERRVDGKGVSAGEKQLLKEARQILGGEIALSEEVGPDRAQEIIDEVLAG